MSLDINWEKLIKDWLDPLRCCELITEKINENIPKYNSPIANLKITKFDLRKCQCPNIEFTDLNDIREEFLLSTGLCRDIQSPPPSEIEDSNLTGIIDAASLLYKRPVESVMSAVMQDGLETTLQIDFDDNDLRIEFEADAVFNVPVVNFLALPLKFTLTRLTISAQLILAVTPNVDRIFMALPVPLKNFHFQLSVDVGDAEKHVLRNVAKIERFLLEQVKILINDRMVLPQFIELPL